MQEHSELPSFEAHVLDAVGHAVAVAALDRTVRYWNKAAEAMLGCLLNKLHQSSALRGAGCDTLETVTIGGEPGGCCPSSLRRWPKHCGAGKKLVSAEMEQQDSSHRPSPCSAPSVEGDCFSARRLPPQLSVSRFGEEFIKP